MFKILNNPKTDLYYEIKNTVISSNFSWFWTPTSVENYDNQTNDQLNVPFYSHIFLTRPNATDEKCPLPSSNLLQSVSRVFIEILENNNINVNCFLRLCANCVHPQEKIYNSVPHVDHNFPHQNALIYLTNAGGKTFIGNEYHNPKEDDVICFEGQRHYMQTPEKERRIVLVATFI